MYNFSNSKVAGREKPPATSTGRRRRTTGGIHDGSFRGEQRSICSQRSEQSSCDQMKPAVSFAPGSNLFDDDDLDNFVKYVDDDEDDDIEQQSVTPTKHRDLDEDPSRMQRLLRSLDFGRKLSKQKLQKEFQKQEQHRRASSFSSSPLHDPPPLHPSSRRTNPILVQQLTVDRRSQAPPSPLSVGTGQERMSPTPPKPSHLLHNISSRSVSPLKRQQSLRRQVSYTSRDILVDASPAKGHSPFTDMNHSYEAHQLTLAQEYRRNNSAANLHSSSTFVSAPSVSDDEEETDEESTTSMSSAELRMLSPASFSSSREEQPQTRPGAVRSSSNRGMIQPSLTAAGDVEVGLLADEGDYKADPYIRKTRDMLRRGSSEKVPTSNSRALVPLKSRSLSSLSSTGGESSAPLGVVGGLSVNSIDVELIAYWRARMNRKEIYTRHYAPSRQEWDEVITLEEYLGIFSTSPGASKRNKWVLLWKQLVPKSQPQQSSTPSSSVVIKRGAIQFEEYHDYHCELILLTRGFVVARPNYQYIPRLQAGDLWTSVVQIQPTSPTGFTIHCSTRGRSSEYAHLTLAQLKQQQQHDSYHYSFSCATTMEHSAWLEALRIGVIQAHDAAGTEDKEEGGLGWQYRLVYVPFFSEAVTGNAILKENIVAGSYQYDGVTDAAVTFDLNKLDSYNSYAPLHYATRFNHTHVMRFLLEAGADVNIGDGYGRTPMYYAELHQLPDPTIQLLEAYGAERSKKPRAARRARRRNCQVCLIISAIIVVLLATGTGIVLWQMGLLDSLLKATGFGVGQKQAGPVAAPTVVRTQNPTASVSFTMSPVPVQVPTEKPQKATEKPLNLSLAGRGIATDSPYPTYAPTTPNAPSSPPTYLMTPVPTITATHGAAPSLSTPSPTLEPSAAPTSGLYQTPLFRLLEAASFDYGASLRMEGSPQQKAFLWLLQNTNLDSFDNEKKIQRYALATFYYSTNGDGWTDNLWWLSDEDECVWFTKHPSEGLPVCQISTSSVAAKTFVTLDLSYNNLAGRIPPEIGLLSGLVKIDLSGGPANALTGILPEELGQLALLETFSVRGNVLTGRLPTQLGNWGMVRSVDLSFNSFSGELPSSFGSMTWITELDVKMNQLSGTLPGVDLGRLMNLFKLDLSANQFSGPIMTQLGYLTKLRYLHLESNEFTSFPNEIGFLTNLATLSVFDNNIQGSIPTEVGLLTNLGSMLLRSNSFISTIPTEIGLMENLLGGLDLSENDLHGPIPTELGRVTLLRSLYLQSNQLSSTLPSELASLSQLNTLRVESNNLGGSIADVVCNAFSTTYPNFYADCGSEVLCPCCTYCCTDQAGCSCQYAGTSDSFLC